MTAEPLTEWTLLALDGPAPHGVAGRAVPATVPGTVHTDLLAAGLIPDPYLDENEAASAWVGRTELAVCDDASTDGPPEDGEHVELVFDGLDTVGEVGLGDHVARGDRATSTAPTGSTSPTWCARARPSSSSTSPPS